MAYRLATVIAGMGTSSQRQKAIHGMTCQVREKSGKGNEMTKAAIRWANDKTKAKHRVRACEIDTQLDLDARKVPIELAERPTSARPGENYRMPFGKHKGKPLKNVPSGYLRWAENNLDHSEVQRNIREMNQPVESQEVPF